MSDPERLAALTSEYNAAVANGLVSKARAIGRVMDAIEREAASQPPSGDAPAFQPPPEPGSWRERTAGAAALYQADQAVSGDALTQYFNALDSPADADPVVVTALKACVPPSGDALREATELVDDWAARVAEWTPSQEQSEELAAAILALATPAPLDPSGDPYPWLAALEAEPVPQPPSGDALREALARIVVIVNQTERGNEDIIEEVHAVARAARAYAEQPTKGSADL